MAITIYADSNIYRYVATGELSITTIGSVHFVYSHVHFDEILRNGNTEMLRGIEALKAVPVVSNENGEYDIDSIGVYLEYEDPIEKFDKYQNDIEPIEEGGADSIKEMLLAFLGADNYEMLRDVPQSIVETALNAAENGCNDPEELVDRANKTASELEEFIERDFSVRRSLTETRKAFGFPEGATSVYGDKKNPLDDIWDHIKNKAGNLSKEQFFGFDAIPGTGIEPTYTGGIASCHLVLNMIGLHPDKGLPKRDKIENILSDGDHAGYASLCNGFLTTDLRLYKKAKAIYEFRGITTEPIHKPYEGDGMSIVIAEPGIINTVKLDKNGLEK